MQVIAAAIANTSQKDPFSSPDTIIPITETLNTTAPAIYTFAHLFAIRTPQSKSQQLPAYHENPSVTDNAILLFIRQKKLKQMKNSINLRHSRC
jgi:hypothetical protein